MSERKLSSFIKPMLAKESVAPFDNDNWIYEIKWDGYRAIAEINGGSVKLYSRNGNDFSSTYPVIVSELKKFKKNVVLDGEIVVLNENGFPDFQKLQDYDSNRHMPIVYYVFDVLEYDGKTFYSEPLLKRKEAVKKVLSQKSKIIRYSDHVRGNGIAFFKSAVEKNLEGVMAKHSESLYHSGKRTNEWLKVKHHHTADVIIAGYTDPAGSRTHFGSLVLAMYDDGKLNYVGNAGTGYDEKKLAEIYKLMQPLKTSKSPFDASVRLPGTTWVIPESMCEVKFSEWTKDRKLRHPVFLRLRNDKSSKQSSMDAARLVKPVTKKKVTAKKSSNSSKAEDEKYFVGSGKKSVMISHLDKVYWPDEGITKRMMVEYYQSVADYILPYLKNRPESLNRNPGGINEKGFYHKDAGDKGPAWLKSFPVYSESSDKQVDYIVCNDSVTLAYLNNLGCIEINPWHSVTSKPDHPDYMIIDIDPSEKNTFEQVIDAACMFREVLNKAGAPSYCKTSGASGLHIYVPMGRKYTYEQVKNFANVVCMVVENMAPSFTTLERSLKKRGSDKIYLDYLQNRKGQTIASVYSLRPKPGATVSMPLDWKEVKHGLSPHDFHISNALKRIKKKGDIFSPILGPGVDIAKCLKKIG